jgi:hypothetical protein
MTSRAKGRRPHDHGREHKKLQEEMREALKNCPPWDHVIIGRDGKVHTIGCYPKPMFGEPGDVKLCGLSRKGCQVLHGGNETALKQIYIRRRFD